MVEPMGEDELREVLGGIARMIEEDTITVPRFKYQLLGTYVESAKEEIRKKDELIARMAMVLREILMASEDLNGIRDEESFAYHIRHSGLKVGHIRAIAEGIKLHGLTEAVTGPRE